MLRSLLFSLLGAALLLSPATAESPDPAALPSLEEVISQLRVRLLGDGSASDCFWQTGRGTQENVPMTISFHHDSQGRFVLDARGTMPGAAGYDGDTPWKQSATGATRNLGLGESERTLLTHWLLSGYWIHPSAPFELALDDDVAGDGDLVLALRFKGTPFDGTLIVDEEEWLPRAFVMTDFGREHEMRFDDFTEVEGRTLPTGLSFIDDGRKKMTLEFTRVQPIESPDLSVFSPRESEAILEYSDLGQGSVAVRRGRWGHHFVRPLINGKDLGWFAFDTGARRTMIDDDIVSEMGFPFISEGRTTGVGGQSKESLHRVETIELGPLRLSNVPVSVSDMDRLRLGLPRAQSGILGMDFLWHCIVVYDQNNSRISLYDPKDFELPDSAWDPMYDYNGKPTISMQFEDREGIFTIDTGNPGGILFNPLTVDRMELLDGRRTLGTKAGGFGGKIEARSGALRWVEFGPRRFRNVPALFLMENKGVAADRSRDGVIGSDLLRRYRVVFDMPGGRIAYLPLDN